MSAPADEERVLALAEAGLTAVQISRALGLAPGNVTSVLHAAPQPVRSLERMRAARHYLTIALPAEAAVRLAEDARRRGFTLPAFARLLLATIATDDLAAAVLDDGDGAP